MIATRTQLGFSLVEMIVVVAIMVASAILVSTTVLSFYRYNAYTIAQASEVFIARESLLLMSRELKEMTFADDGAYPLITAEPHRLIFYSDIDRDESVELVEYRLASTTLEKLVYSAAGSPPVYSTSTISEQALLGEFIQNIDQAIPTFTYYDASGMMATSTTLITDIRYVLMQVKVNVDPVRNPEELLLRSSATLRNLKDNL